MFVVPEVGVAGVVVFAGVRALLLHARLVARLPFAPACGAICSASFSLCKVGNKKIKITKKILNLKQETPTTRC